eukprot:6179955-Pleurochrysis_carterae.AAC.1
MLYVRRKGGLLLLRNSQWAPESRSYWESEPSGVRTKRYRARIAESVEVRHRYGLAAEHPKRSSRPMACAKNGEGFVGEVRLCPCGRLENASDDIETRSLRCQAC